MHEGNVNYAALDTFMSEGFKNIEGWCSPFVAKFVKALDEMQRQRGVRGGIAEVGVHHGLLFIMLNQVCEADERSYAIDIFEDQSLNVDYSGQGSKSAFVENLKRYDRHRGDNVSIISADSTAVEMSKLIKEPVRFFSVDGGHTVEHTICDLHSAHAALHPEGVVILDDILNSHWLGVLEGAVLFMSQKPTLMPFAIGHNKMFFAQLSHVDRYRQLFKSSGFATKPHVRFFGHDLVAL